MNSTNRQTTLFPIIWKRAKPAGRLKRVARLAFRVTWNMLAILGACFVYFLVLGYLQYQNEASKTEVQCAVSHCM